MIWLQPSKDLATVDGSGQSLYKSHYIEDTTYLPSVAYGELNRQSFCIDISPFYLPRDANSDQ